MIENPKENILTDLDRVKDELLSYITKLENKVNMKLALFETKQDTSFNQFQREIDTMSIQYVSMAETVTEQKVKITKIEELEAFKRKSDDQLISHEIRINNLRKEFDRSVEKNDRIFVDNLVVPGYVGECAQFKNMREYTDYNIATVAGLVASKEKLTVDLKEYKVKLEGLISIFSSQVEKYNKSQIDYINSLHVESKDYIAEQMKIINDEIFELRMQNCKYAVELKNKTAEIIIDWDKLMNIRKEIYTKFDEKVDEFKETEKKTSCKVLEMKKEFNRIKLKFNELVDFIKDVRFRRNLEKDNFEGIKKKEVTALTKRIIFARRPSKSFDISNQKEEDLEVDFDYDYYEGQKSQYEKIGRQSVVLWKKDKPLGQKPQSLYQNMGTIEEHNKKNTSMSSLHRRRKNSPNNAEDGDNKAIIQFADIMNDENIITSTISPIPLRGKKSVDNGEDEQENGDEVYFSNTDINFHKKINTQNNERPKNHRIAINDFKDKTEKGNNVNDNKRMNTEKKSKCLSPDLSRKRHQINKDMPNSEYLRVVALNYEPLIQSNYFSKKGKEQINVSFKPIKLSKNDQGKKFSTVKESPHSAIKISFGSSILNAKEGRSNRDRIDCNQKSNLNMVLVSQNLLK